MEQPSTRDKLSLTFAVLCGLDLLLGIVLISRLAWDRRVQGEEILVDIQITVDSWTIYRPFVFALIFGVMFLSQRLSGISRKIITGIGFGIGLLYYVVRLTWFDLVAIYENYQIAELEKPFLFGYFGWNEWDLIRGVLLAALFVWWSYRLFKNMQRMEGSIVTIRVINLFRQAD